MTKRFPFPSFPRGWYGLAFSTELKPGALITRQIAGEELILYRTASGEARATDAHCPHMGAHFGHGGVVNGELLECPFHHFCFDGEGRCASTPYGTKLPPNAKLRTWPLHETHGILLVFYDPEGAAPTWRVPELDMTGWGPLISTCWTLNTHPQETTENSVDLGHLAVVHKYEAIEITKPLETDGPYLSINYGMQRPGNPFKPTEKLRTQFDVHVHGLGYSFVDVDIISYGLRSRHFVLSTPIDDQTAELRIALSLKDVDDPGRIHPSLRLLPKAAINKIVSRLTFKGYREDVMQDFEIWQNKKYLQPAALAVGDGPIGPYRKWARQFYVDKKASQQGPRRVTA